MTENFKPIFTITNRITAGLTRIERARGFLEAATLSEAWVREMGRRASILEVHHITHIEGTRRPWNRPSDCMVDMELLVSEGATNKLVCRMKGLG